MKWNEAIKLLKYNGNLSVKEQDSIVKLLEHGKASMLALESLTPQGSEFYNDIEYCVDYLKKQRMQNMDHIKRLVVANREGRELLK